MTYEPDDPRLTAYALNELDEDASREIEAHLQEDPEARRMVEEIRATSALLTTELKKESGPKLHTGQRVAIQTVARIGTKSPPSKRPEPLRQYRPFIAAAAALLLISVTMFWFTTEKRNAPVALKTYGYKTPPSSSVSADAKHQYAENPKEERLETSSEKTNSDEVFSSDSRENVGAFAGRERSQFGYSRKEKEGEVERMRVPASETRTEIQQRMKERQAILEEAEKKAAANETPLVVGRKEGVVKKLPSSMPQGATTPADYAPQKSPVAPPSSVRTQPTDDVGKRAVGGLAFDDKFKNEFKKAQTRPLAPDEGVTNLKNTVDNPAPLGDRISTTSPATPLNPLGYTTPEAKKPEPPLRYAPTQYRSYIQPTYILPQGSEEYARVNDNTFRDTSVLEHRLSTFSADIDTAAYSNVRRFLNQRQLPPVDAVRIEEMVNYFKYDYAAPNDGKPFHVFMELAQCPWNPNHKLARIGIKAAEIAKDQRPTSNLVFLIDVSGSMEDSTRLPLVKKGLMALVENLNENDRVAIVTYANGTTLALPSTPCSQKNAITRVIASLKADGGTNGGDGIQRAYEQAAQNFVRGGVNRVILATDGDFNIGITDQTQLTALIEAKAKEGVFLTVLGYGMGNLKDAKLELLAGKGNGHYAYVDTEAESRRVLVDQLCGTLVTVAKDVKFQVEFNPARVRGHRLVGYENRVLEHADFNNDAKDAGEIGAGHIVTALYEIVPTRASVALPGTDPLRYLPAEADAPAQSEELLMLKIRYKLHNQDTSNLLEFPIEDAGTSYAKASKDFKFCAAVAGFGMLLRGSPYRGNSTFDSVLELATECVNGVPERKEFIELVQKARELRR